MKLGTLLFAVFVAIVAICFSYPIVESGRRVRSAYLESAEEPLVDTANVLAELVSLELARGDFDPERLYAIAERTRARELHARIYRTIKSHVDLDVYITDARGRVLFHSRDRALVGADYANWRDVRRTLAGTYGARVSNPSEPLALYVAAPIRVNGRIAGVLTVVKPTTAVHRFLERTQPYLLALVAVATGAALLLMFLVSLWVHGQVRRLTRYADAVREGRRVPFPELAPTELRQMGLAFERMRESLAGHAYIESYVRALTHEIKSPISAIRGAAEILESPSVDPARRERFLRNIQNETRRVEDLVDRMLDLSELEARRALPTIRAVPIAAVLRTIVEAQDGAMRSRELEVSLDVPESLEVRGDEFLLHLALSNLIKNAVEWSPRGGTIRIAGEQDGPLVRVTIDDEGPGIPGFARARVFERFYSLERPDTGRKSTGLGLNFVSEVAKLHHGRVALEPRSPHGTHAILEVRAADEAPQSGGGMLSESITSS